MQTCDTSCIFNRVLPNCYHWDDIRTQGADSQEDRRVAALSAQVVRHGHQEAAEYREQHRDVVRLPGLLWNTDNQKLVFYFENP